MAVPQCLVGVIMSLRHYRLVLVQAALELAPLYPTHAIHR
jgi:hypothetical protein